MLNKIQSHVRCIHGRRLTLFQRASYSNACILSRLWYVAHVYPLSSFYGNQINKEVFKYLWGGRYEPIKRTTVWRGKEEGGMGVFDCIAKASAIMVKSFLKLCLAEQVPCGFVLYYCYFRLCNLLPQDVIYPIVHSIPSPYYSFLIDKILKIAPHPKFPLIVKKQLYKFFIKEKEVTVETKFPLFNWRRIWSNFNGSHINLFEKDLVYKHLHEVLTVKKRLMMLNLSDTANCHICNVEESAIHLFYFCPKIQSTFLMLLRTIKNLCDYEPTDKMKFIYFDFEIKDSRKRNVCVLLLYSYLSTVWSLRDNQGISSAAINAAFKRKCLFNKNELLLAFNHECKKWFGSLLEKIQN